MKAFLKERGIPEIVYDRSNNRLGSELAKEDVLKKFVKSDKHVGSALRKWVIDYEIIDYKCSVKTCMFSTTEPIWNGDKLVLELDHVNGDNKDNRIENLRFLCPNCHSQTDTYKGKNKRKGVANIPVSKDVKIQMERFILLPEPDVLRNEISILKSKANVARKYGVSIYAVNAKLEGKNFNYNIAHKPKIEWPEISELIDNVQNKGWESVSEILGVSGNAIRKHLKIEALK